MKHYTYIVFLLALVSCKTDYVFIDSFKGGVYDITNNKPIKGVVIQTDSLAINFFEPIKTKNDGSFYVDGMTVKSYKTYVVNRKNISFKLYFKSKYYSCHTIDLKSYNKDNRKLDVVKLGKIYLKPLNK
ncbi:hypothetical protein NH341_08380 [Tenacibaculum sp. XPcli2-G]|uniref:Carboxypeptidase regulatory-like domain-containing protein n=1 Tax=Tenacibaculum sp. Pbs-1 TaxID=3238748 RepID=A0AB33KT37_9FLAO|nr:hypothetical protein [Tenacibaculum sp. XPcli2-G]MCO7185440.1 hypothetical protein [Tenacibaculum sp. XPcli2-G]